MKQELTTRYSDVFRFNAVRPTRKERELYNLEEVLFNDRIRRHNAC